MFNKQKFEKIITGKISQEELYSYNDLEKIEYDLDKPFNKYYNFKYIENIVEKCLNKKITVKYLAKWANIYNWILTPENAKEDENFLCFC